MQNNSMAKADPQRLGVSCDWFSHGKQRPNLENDGFRAIALLSVFSYWHTTVLVDSLHEEGAD